MNKKVHSKSNREFSKLIEDLQNGEDEDSGDLIESVTRSLGESGHDEMSDANEEHEIVSKLDKDDADGPEVKAFFNSLPKYYLAQAEGQPTQYGNAYGHIQYGPIMRTCS